MKISILSLSLVSILFVACTNNGSDKKVSDSATNVEKNQETSDNKLPASKVLSDYLKLKNALTKDNDKDAAAAASELIKALESMDKASLNAEQAKVYNDIKDDAVEHAEHIASNGDNIEHQREHFHTLSQEVYELLKAIGAGQKLYYANCPMYNGNKGANWISETQDIQNPYLGQAMLTCGSVIEELN